MHVKIVSNEKEYQDALDVRRNVFIKEQQVPEELELDEYEETATHFVVYDGEQPIGAGRCRKVENACKVERICVLPDYRNKRIGLAIMEKIEQVARERKRDGLKLNAQIHAERFYKRLGYITTSDEFLDAGIPHVAMKKTF